MRVLRSSRFRVSQSCRPAFTLIEILVVVSIIALLIAILLPSLKAARERARDTVCMSNLHALGVASSSYAAGNSKRNVFPDWWAVGGASFRAMVGVAVSPRPGIPGSPEIYGLPALFAKLRILPAGSEVWICPLNVFDAKYKNTYQWHNSDYITQETRNYQVGSKAGQTTKTARAMWIQDNYNLKPYTSGVPRPPDRDRKAALGETAFDRGSRVVGSSYYQGSNTGFFLGTEEWHYYHKAASTKYRTKGDTPADRRLPYGRGVRGIHLDLSAGFMANGEAQSADPDE